MRFTIERLRTVVLAAGVLLVAALAVFLTLGHWKSLLNRRDLPKRLGIDIEQEANGFLHVESRAGHTLFKIRASKATEFKNNHVLLHDVTIELYGQDGRSVDRIAGSEFEYNQTTGVATAQGQVEITLMRPSEAPAIAPRAAAGQAMSGKQAGKPHSSAAPSAAGEIHVETSGLSFDQKTGIVTTSQHVVFSMAKGQGSAMGASYNAQQGQLVLDRAVELTTARGGQPVTIHARHAELERDDQLCTLLDATANYRGGHATAGLAKILFRNDGSAQRLNATGGFTLATAAGAHLAAPTGVLQFDPHNQPQHGGLQGGVKMDSVTAERQLHGTAPTAVLDFSPQGQLRLIDLNQGVDMRSETEGQTSGAHPVPLRVSRTWRSPVAQVAFRPAGRGQVEPASMHGSGGVVVTSETRRGNAAPAPSRLAADQVTAGFGPNSVLQSVTGAGHASIDQTTAQGARQTATGDRLEAQFEPAFGARLSASGRRGEPARREAAVANGQPGPAQIQSAVLEGHVVLVQQPAPKPGAPGDRSSSPGWKPGEPPQPPLRATAGRADYDNAGQWLHLTQSPRIEDGGFELTADKVDVSQQSGDAFAHGGIKATWISGAAPATGQQSRPVAPAAGADAFNLGGQGPAHAIAAEAQFNQSSGVAEFRGHARLWQQANSIAGPLIVLNRQKQTLMARSANPAEPVQAVLLSADGASAPGAQAVVEPVKDTEIDAETRSDEQTRGRPSARPQAPSIIRVRGGDFTYSDVEHRAVMTGGSLGPVVAETGAATCTANQVVLLLRPPGHRAANRPAQGQVERLTAIGQVVVSSQGRRGTGAQLVYTGATGGYVLTGTPSAPPRLTDPARGTVTGQALIFNSRDDSVSIEGGGHETTTQTTAPRYRAQVGAKRKPTN